MADSRLNRVWDTLGQYMGAAGEVGESMSRRNLDLWTRVSATLRQDAENRDLQLKQEAEQLVMAAMQNSRELWGLLMSSPNRRSVAAPLPTAFLRFEADVAQTGRYTPPDGVWIRGGADAPAAAVRIVSGPEDGTEQLERCLVVGAPERRGYYLGTRNVGELKPGSYTGVVCAADTRRPLADLRVEVAGA